MVSFVIFLIIGLSFGVYGEEEFLGRFGAVYDIEEKDMVEEIYEAVKKVDYVRIREKKRKEILGYIPKNLIKLEKARETEVYYVDYEYVLPEEVKIPVNGEWRVLYKKGFKFKPLKFIKFRPVDLLIFDGSDDKQISFVKKNFVDKNIRVRYVICGGNYRVVMNRLKVPVYYLFGRQFRHLNLKYSISRVSVDLNRGQFRIDVYALDEQGKLKDSDYRLDENSYLERVK